MKKVVETISNEDYRGPMTIVRLSQHVHIQQDSQTKEWRIEIPARQMLPEDGKMLERLFSNTFLQMEKLLSIEALMQMVV